MMNLKPHIKIAFIYFLMAALVGVVLRSFQVFEIPINYKFFVHTHSHIALLGWVYLALTTMIHKLFVQNPVKDKKYQKIFWFTQLTLIGMVLTFPFQGYALFSIVFSTLFLFASYWFFRFFKKHVKREYKKTNSHKCINTALWFMVLSSIGPWTLGAIMNILGADSVWYRLAIYFYLHFQYNGWMILALIGLFFYVAEQQQIQISYKTFNRFFWTFNLGMIFSFFLSTLFAKPPIVFNVLGGFGAVFQLLSLGFLIRMFTDINGMSKVLFSSLQMRLLRLIVIFLGVKMILQLVTSIPYFANLAATIIDFTVGYLHWTFLGVITLGIFFFLNHFKLVRIPKKAYYLYLMGFFITEILIFYRGIATWKEVLVFEDFLETLVLGSGLIPISLAIILGANLLNKP